jgi:hypothetical protein
VEAATQCSQNIATQFRKLIAILVPNKWLIAKIERIGPIVKKKIKNRITRPIIAPLLIIYTPKRIESQVIFS